LQAWLKELEDKKDETEKVIKKRISGFEIEIKEYRKLMEE
jgi:hypothetical protein